MLVSAQFERYGLDERRSARCVVALFSDVRDATGNLLANHIWLRMNRILAVVELRPGAIVTFAGRVNDYVRRNGTRDYCFDMILGLRVQKQGERRVPARVWRFLENGIQYVGCKYYLDGGPRCYRVNVETNEWDRIKYHGPFAFKRIPEIVPVDDLDREVICQFIKEDWYGSIWATAQEGS